MRARETLSSVKWNWPIFLTQRVNRNDREKTRRRERERRKEECTSVAVAFFISVAASIRGGAHTRRARLCTPFRGVK